MGDDDSSQPAILLAHGDTRQLKSLADLLCGEGYSILSATDGETALHIAQTYPLLLILLDVHLPGRDGLEMCRLLRSTHETAYIPILMLSTNNDETETIVGLEVGADDYISSKLKWGVMRARIRALLRRSQYEQLPLVSVREGKAKEAVEGENRQMIVAGDLRIDLAGRQVLRKEEPIELSTRLFDLLVYLVRHRGVVLTRLELLEQIRGESAHSEERLLDVYIHWLREKLEEDSTRPCHLQTIRGIGYRLTL